MARVIVRLVRLYDIEVPAEGHAEALSAARRMSGQEIQDRGVERRTTVHPMWVRPTPRGQARLHDARPTVPPAARPARAWLHQVDWSDAATSFAVLMLSSLFLVYAMILTSRALLGR